MSPEQIPDWYVEALRIVQRTDGILRNTEIKLLDFIETEEADIRVRTEMERVLDALHGTIGTLALVEMTARNALDDSALRTLPQTRTRS
ncbi:MAG: hypothetical protein WCA32_25175 [Chromatiaceae bacterium]